MDRRPIGYWLREVDRLIEQDFTRLLATERLTRRHWQVLNILAERPRTIAELDGELAPFRTAQAPTVEPVVADLRVRGWADGTVALTEQGRVRHRDLNARVVANRLRLTDGISAEEYRVTIGVLERMAANLTIA